jgi:PIN domain nuclease of toxin-antitoxin system
MLASQKRKICSRPFYFAANWMKEAGFRELPVTAVHAAAVRALPDIHRDPFDRLLVAQAVTEPLRLLTDDDNVARYTDLVIKI